MAEWIDAWGLRRMSNKISSTNLAPKKKRFIDA
jgi:hypothetical protein